MLCQELWISLFHLKDNLSKCNLIPRCLCIHGIVSLTQPVYVPIVVESNFEYS